MEVAPPGLRCKVQEEANILIYNFNLFINTVALPVRDGTGPEKFTT